MKYWGKFTDEYGIVIPFIVLSAVAGGFGFILLAVAVSKLLPDVWREPALGLVCLVPGILLLLWYRAYAKMKRVEEVTQRMGV
jgi:hypothetical protein